MMQATFNREKFRELILHIATASADDPSFGAVKLNKILFFSDFLAYAQLGAPITGATYQKLRNGPCPREVLPVRNEMESAGEIGLEKRAHFQYAQLRVVAKRQPDLSRFSGSEIAIVDEVIRSLQMVNASDVSAISHRMSIGWQFAQERETIPYETIFLDDEPLTDEEIGAGQALARELGLLE